MERIEDLTYFRKRPRKSWIARMLRIPSHVANPCGRPISLLTLAACFVFPVAIFLAFAVALQFRFSSERTDRSSPVTSSSSTVRHRSKAHSYQPSKENPVVTRKSRHSTDSSVITKKRPGVSIEEVYDSTPAPPIEELGHWIRNLLSENRDEEPHQTASTPPAEENRLESPRTSNESLDARLTPAQREAIKKLAQKAQRELQTGASAEEVKRELRTEIRAVLKEK